MREDVPKVMVTDLEMPGMSGLELAERVREIDPRIRIIMVTGAGDEEAAQAALRLGLSDYLTKPIDLGSLARAVQGAFMAHARDEYAQEMDQWLRDEVRRQTGVIQEVTLGTLESLLNALEARSPYFKGHSQSVAVCAAGIGRELGLPEQEVKSIRTAGLLHDIGMMAVPDAVVNKPGELDPHEYGAIVAHCRKGAEILESMAHLGPAITFVLEHHERLDGTGYPDQKKGDQISLGGQIVGLAEAWTALIEQRSYRDRMRPADALATLLGAVGLWFSAELIEALRASEM
jgi:putative nucleotidyltransferase with HDIG domain